jgi:tetratricopeptide (TPR) repeat protein
MGISIANYSEILIQENNFSGSGISIAAVASAFIQGNVIDGGSISPFAGVFMDNSGGYIRCNIVTDCLNGIRLANSSPDIGDNTLEHNKYHGLFIGTGSIPNMIGQIISGPPYTWYGASGYNRITENGMGSVYGEPPDNDGSEIYFSSSSALLGEEKRPGCNVIADDRQSTPSMSTLLLLNGSLSGGDGQLYAQNNYWGTEEPIEERFGSLSVLYSPYYSEPCLFPEGGGEEKLLLTTSTGIVVDTLNPSVIVPVDISVLEESYAVADKYFISGNIEFAKPIYEQIVAGNYTSAEKLLAYNKLYTIANLTGADNNYFSGLQNTFDNIANTETDTLLIKIYKQNAIKCDVSKEDYLTAISKFDYIIQQNPNSEEAVYAEIDIMTTALNLDTTNTGLGKIAGGKYLVKGTSDYLTKLNNLLQNKFGINKEEKEQIIPKEYSLYQNYPNPFNPATTIKFDIPKDGLITLDIYDILGRRITTLVSEFRSAGSYEQVFNASSLASGVYVYKLQAGDYVNSKKMILIK